MALLFLGAKDDRISSRDLDDMREEFASQHRGISERFEILPSAQERSGR
jgi:hypothetical protein